MLIATCADESYHVCDRGYLSLFPLLLGLLPADSPHLGSILDLLRDPDHLWTSYGLRSLSASHPQFGQGENYWKGPIWIQMNFLALRALHTVREFSKSSITWCADSFELEICGGGRSSAAAGEGHLRRVATKHR